MFTGMSQVLMPVQQALSYLLVHKYVRTLPVQCVICPSRCIGTYSKTLQHIPRNFLKNYYPLFNHKFFLFYHKLDQNSLTDFKFHQIFSFKIYNHAKLTITP